jgi:hypothetical protein
LKKGQIKAENEGTAEITATWEGLSAKMSLTVKPVLKGIKSNVSNIKMNVGEKVSPSISAEYKGARSQASKSVSISTSTMSGCTVVSSNSAVAAVNSDGQIVALSKGKAVITVTMGSKKTTIKVTTSYSISDARLVVRKGMAQVSSADVTVNSTFALNAVLLYPDGLTKNITSLSTWSMENLSVATDNKGKIKGITEGSTILTVSYNGLSSSVTINVSQVPE